MHTLHSNTDKIFNYSITTTCELHTERRFIVIQDSVKAGKLQIQKNSCNTIIAGKNPLCRVVSQIPLQRLVANLLRTC